MRIKLSVGGTKQDDKPEQTEEQKIKAELGGKKVSCRICQGEHFTARCPYKDTLGEADDVAPSDEAITGADAAGAAAGGPGKYVPPSMRGGAAGRGAGESMYGAGRNRDDYPTLRVTNLSEDTTEDDLWGIFQRFGRVHRVYLGRDQVTGDCKGFAFVSFEEKKDAEAAMKKVHGWVLSTLTLVIRHTNVFYVLQHAVRTSYPLLPMVRPQGQDVNRLPLFASCLVLLYNQRLHRS
jgi:translation initiation factor 3 subunit G